MKTIRSLMVASAIMLVMLCAGCATTAPQPLNPAQVLSIACPPVQAAIVQFEAVDAALGVTNPQALKAGAALQKVQPLVAAACASGTTVSTANIQAFAQSVLPALGQVAGTLPLPPAQMAQVQAGLIAAEIAVGAIGVVEQQIQAAKASTASPAPAPTP